MASRKEWDAIRRISGDRNTSGIKAGTAFDTGIKRDEVPPHIRNLANDIKPAETPAPKLSRQTEKLRKYKIEGDTAYVSTEIFRSTFLNSGEMNFLEKAGVKHMKISSGNADMIFMLFDEATDDPSIFHSTPSIMARDIVTSGVVQAAGFEQKLLVMRNLRIVGVLEVFSTDETIAKVGKNQRSGTIHTTEWGKDDNALAVFKDSATVERAAYYYSRRGGLALTRVFTNSSGQQEIAHIGTLLSSVPDFESKELRKTQARNIEVMLRISSANNAQQFVQHIFREASHGYVIYSGTQYDQLFPVGFLVPHKDFE